MSINEYGFGNPEQLGLKAEKLPYKEVSAQLLWQNSNFPHPLNLMGKNGKLQLARFLSTERQSSEGNMEVESFQMNNQGRAGVVGRVIFKDAQDKTYRDIVAKGIGLYTTDPVAEVQNPSLSGISGRTLGILYKNKAEEDKGLSNKFLNCGVDAPVPMSIYTLNEIVVDGKIVSIQTAREKGLLEIEGDPVVYIRAFGVNSRFVQLAWPNSAYLWKDAKKFIEETQGKKMSTKEYFLWLVKKQAANIALIHKNGHTHQGLIWGHNLTLDGKIVDFSDNSYTEYDAKFDKRHLIVAFTDLLERLKNLNQLDTDTEKDFFMGELEDSYSSSFKA